jgi:hypothetical protein
MQRTNAADSQAQSSLASSCTLHRDLRRRFDLLHFVDGVE